MYLPAARPAPQPAPQAPAPLANDPKLIEDLVYANRILYQQEVLDGFGHVSVRSDKDPSHFLMSRSMAPALVTSKDIMEYDKDGEPVDARGRNSYVERYIHAAIYRVRPEVKAVVHSHSPDIIPYSVTGTILRPVYHVSAFLRLGAPIFDSHDGFGDTDMLIRDNKLGDALAKVLGNSGVALIRGHGFVAVARFDSDCGVPRDLHADECARSSRRDEAWHHQVSDARGSGEGPGHRGSARSGGRGNCGSRKSERSSSSVLVYVAPAFRRASA